MIAKLKKEMAKAVSRSKDQGKKIQRVSSQSELNKTATGTIANN